MNIRFTFFALVVSVCFVLVGHTNMYNSWAQKNAVNLNQPDAGESSDSMRGDSGAPSEIHPPQNSVAQEIQNARNNIAIENHLANDPLSRPKYNYIQASDIGKYRYTDRYLDLADADVSHYFILQEGYVFRNLDGRTDSIPAGFIWDGASIPKVKGAIGLEVGNTRYASALAEGLIHDYMYRNPQRYTKEEADKLFYDNLKRCNNPNPWKMYQGVVLKGGPAYRRHQNNQQRGDYDVFTPEFYLENLRIFQDGNKHSDAIDTSKLEPVPPRSKSNYVSDDSDFDCCKCADPDDSDFHCKKCGKISKWMAPHRDKEFEQMLKR